MKSNVFVETASKIQKFAEVHSEILVAYSGGKDSMVVLDLCCKAFKKVVCYHMYFSPGLQVVDKYIEWAKQRYNVPIIMTPDSFFVNALRDGTFCDPWPELRDMPDSSYATVAYTMMNQTGIMLHADGKRRDDSLARLMNVNRQLNFISPISAWRKWEVLAYLKLNNIPIPESLGGRTSNVNLFPDEIFWLHDEHPEDYERLKKWFPYIEAVLHRREWFGERGTYDKYVKQMKFNRRNGRGQETTTAAE